MARQTKTPRQRAEEALGVADRLLERLEAKRSQLTEELIVVEREKGIAKKRRDYLAANPDLPQTGMDVPEPPRES